MESSGIKWNQVESNGIKWNQVESNGIKRNQMESNLGIIIKIKNPLK